LHQSLSYASMIRVTRSVYHDYDHIYITPMVDLFINMIYGCKLIDVYVTSFLYACFDQTIALGEAVLWYAQESDIHYRCFHGFYLSMIASLGRMEYLWIMSSSDKKDALVSLK
jgi:hypothetical protein